MFRFVASLVNDVTASICKCPSVTLDSLEVMRVKI